MSGIPLRYRLYLPSETGFRNQRVAAYAEISKTIAHYTKSLYHANYQHFIAVQYGHQHYTNTTPHYTHLAFARKRLRVYTIVVFSFIRTFAPSF